MSLPRFFIADLTSEQITLDPEQARHALNSLRLRVGERLELFDGCGKSATGELMAAEANGKKREAIVHIKSCTESPKPQTSLALFVAAPKGPRLTAMIEKCTELGVSALHFTNWQRSVVHVAGKSLDKFQKNTIEACKQCGRNWLPTISAENGINDFLAATGTRYIAHPDPHAPLFGTLAGVNNIALAIGPEGGFTTEEVSRMTAAYATPIQLSPNILRIETAALAAAAIWNNRLA